MRSPLITLALAAALTAPALAALDTGAAAPTFKAPASLGGKEFSFDLAAALKKGPVVLYFYPAAFTTGCTLEAHAFADAIDKFSAMHATVIGVSHDDIATLDKFSVSECRSKFAVAADPSLAIAKQYDAVLPSHPTFANRISYVLGQDGKVISVLTDMSHPDAHVQNALKVIGDYEKSKRP